MLPEIEINDVITVAPGRRVKVRIGPARSSIVTDWRGRIAVRNIATNRLSYIRESHLRWCKARYTEPSR